MVTNLDPVTMGIKSGDKNKINRDRIVKTRHNSKPVYGAPTQSMPLLVLCPLCPNTCMVEDLNAASDKEI